jgi:hypothetical protein
VMHIAAPAPAVNVGLFVQWTEEQELPLEQRSMLLCEFKEDNNGNTTLFLVLAESEMLRRSTVLLNNQPVFSDITFSIVRYKLSFLTLLGVDEEGHAESLLWAFLPDETEETFTRVLSTWKAAVFKLTGVQLKPSVALSYDCDAEQNALECSFWLC